MWGGPAPIGCMFCLTSAVNAGQKVGSPALHSHTPSMVPCHRLNALRRGWEVGVQGDG